jgi:translocation and assembly module TamB
MYGKDRSGKPDRAPGTGVGLRPTIFIILGVVVALIVPLAFILAVHLPSVQKEVIDGVVGWIESDTTLNVQLDGYKWWPFSRLQVFKLKVRSEGKDVLECEQAELSYRLSWSWPYLVPTDLYFDQPVLRLEKDSKGQWRFPKAAKSEPRSEARKDVSRWLRFPWPPVRIRSGVITAEQDGQSILHIRDVSGALSFQAVSGEDGTTVKVKLGDWGGHTDVPQWGPWHVSGEVELHERKVVASGLVVDVGEGGSVACEGSWGLDSPYDGDVTVRMSSLRLMDFQELQDPVPGLQTVSGLLHVKRESGVWAVDHDVITNLGSLKGSLEAGLASKGTNTVHWVTRFADLKVVQPVLPPAVEASLSGQLELSLDGNGLGDMTARLSGKIDPSRFGEITIEGGEVEASYDKGVLTVKTVEMKSSAGVFSLGGNADMEGFWNTKHQGEMKADLKIEQGNVEKVLGGPKERVDGMVRLEAHYGPGDFSNWEKWAGKLESKVNVPDLLSLKASGDFKASIFNLDYDIEARDLAKASLFFPSWQGKGRLASKGKLKGPWSGLVWDGLATSSEFEYGTVRIEQCSLTGKGEVLGKQGNRKLSFKTQGLNVDGNKIGSLSLEVEQQGDACRFRMKGEQSWNRLSTDFSGRIDSIFAPPQLLTVSQGQISWMGQTCSLDGKLELHKEKISVHSLNLQQGGQKVHLAGELALDGGSDMKANVENVNTGQWMTILGFEDLVTGSASGELQLVGRAEQPELSLSLQLANGGLQIKQKREVKGRKTVVTVKEPIGVLRLKGQYSRDVLQLQGELQSKSDQKPIQLSAKVPVRLTLSPFNLGALKNVEWSSSWKITDVRGEQLVPYIPVIVSAGGRFDAEGRGSGTLGQPVVQTTGVWTDGSFQATDWPHPVENVHVEFRADDRNIYVTKSDMRHLGGHVSVTGKIDYPNFDVMEWEAVGEDLKMPLIYGVEGKVACRVRLIQDLEKADLSGELQFSKASMNLGEFQSELERNIDIVEGDDKGEVLLIQGDEKQQKNYYNRLKMDLTLRLPPSGTWVRGKGLNAEITGNLKMVKDRYEPWKFVGGFQTIRGTYTFQAMQLDIIEGEIVFLGSSHPDPNLKIVCQKQVRDVTVQVQVTGPLSQPKLVLSSIPTMNQVDVLSYLLFGHPATELGAKESSQLQNSAASWLGSQTSNVLKGMFGKSKFAPDSLSYRGSTSKTDRTTGTTTQGGVIEIGKHITPDLTVTYGQGVMGENENEVEVEYRFNRHLSVQTQVGNGEQSGLDFFWRYDFGK